MSDDAVHDLVAKDDVYAEHHTRRAYLDPDERYGWWFKADGVEHAGPAVTWQIEGWPPVVLDRAVVLAPPSAGVGV